MIYIIFLRHLLEKDCGNNPIAVSPGERSAVVHSISGRKLASFVSSYLYEPATTLFRCAERPAYEVGEPDRSNYAHDLLL
jgi:hypothetical protein